MEPVFSYGGPLRRVRESLYLETEVHTITRAQLVQSRVRVVALEALLRNAGTQAAEGEGQIFEARVEEVDNNAEVHSKGEIESEFSNIVMGIDVEGSGDGGVPKNLHDPVTEKDAGKEPPAVPTPKMEGVVLVEDVKVSMGDANVGRAVAVSEGVAQDVTGKTSRGCSASNIAQCIKRGGKVSQGRFDAIIPVHNSKRATLWCIVEEAYC